MGKKLVRFQHINDLSLHIELPWALSKAEGIYHQLMAVAPDLPNNVRVIIGLEPLTVSPSSSDREDEASAALSTRQYNDNADTSSRKNSNGSDNIKFGNNEVSYERGLNVSYM